MCKVVHQKLKKCSPKKLIKNKKVSTKCNRRMEPGHVPVWDCMRSLLCSVSSYVKLYSPSHRYERRNLTKLKYNTMLLYGTEACPRNSSVKQSLQFIFNRVLCKIFGAMSSDSFVMVCNFSGLKPVEDLICAQHGSICYEIYLDSEQFMWPNIEEILLTMFLFLR